MLIHPPPLPPSASTTNGPRLSLTLSCSRTMARCTYCMQPALPLTPFYHRHTTYIASTSPSSCHGHLLLAPPPLCLEQGNCAWSPLVIINQLDLFIDNQLWFLRLSIFRRPKYSFSHMSV